MIPAQHPVVEVLLKHKQRFPVTNLDAESGVSPANISGLTTRWKISGEQASFEGFWRVQVNSHGVHSAAEFHCGGRRRWMNSLRWRRLGGLWMWMLRGEGRER